MTDMFRSQTTTNEAAMPALIAWHVTNRGESSYWNRVGAAWDHRDGKGITLVLDTMPIDGRVVLRVFPVSAYGTDLRL